jgi:endonuclease/exonuclease/phosphatase family metal-dependent hydrolase
VTQVKFSLIRISSSRRLAVSLSLCIAAAWWQLPIDAQCATPLRVLTYNIHHSEGRDGAFNLERIAAVIREANPDIVALQELDQGNTRSGVNVFQLDQLATLTGMQGHFGKTIDYRSGAYGNGVLLRNSFHPTGIVNHPLPNPVGGEARAVMELRISSNGVDSSPEFVFFATHLTASSDATNRLAQAGAINSLIEASTAPALLAGDFNSIPSSSVMSRLFEHWSDATTSLPARPRGSQIDYVLYRNGDQWSVSQSGDFIVSPVTAVASDHFPYVVVLHLVPEPSTMASLAGACGALVVLRQQGMHTARCRCGKALELPSLTTSGLGAARCRWRRHRCATCLETY